MTPPDARQPGSDDGDRTVEAVLRPPVGSTRAETAPAGSTRTEGDDGAFARPAGADGPFDPPERRRPVVQAPPPASPAQQAAFGRPAAVAGSFAGDRPTPPPRPVAPPPPEAVLRAFRASGGQAGLQEPPGGRPGRRRTSAGPWWKSDARSDPWRDPHAPAGLTGPAVFEEESEQEGPVVVDRRGRRKLRLRDLSVRVAALVVLAVLLAGALGGGVGYLLTREAAETPLLAPGTTLSETDEGVTREPGSVSDIADRVSPAVVSIEVRIGDAGATGSGVVVDGENGYIVTNNHVISGADGVEGAEIRAVFSDGNGSEARIVGRDPASDIAVVKVERPGLVTASLGSADDVVVGDPVVAIGSPLGLAGTVTSGIVSALDRPVRLAGEGSDTNAVISAVQTDAPINPGNSGGALVDATGAVIGINTAIASLGGGSVGLGFAIPIDTARDIAEQLIATGSAVHAALGVNTRSVTDGTRDGALVLNVEPGSAAAAAGIREQDVIIAVDDRRVGSSEELVVAVDSRRPGDVVTVELVRNGSSTTVQATLDQA
ncbi:serine protease, S1-C subfamily, contains C-terminal PDZ domain [Geodermatophilus obscurus]|uniref:Serine protease, S1-C subfamily, contains C-terminal PDZ domain n=1 Tax=Geodermatophilus obscurus TaxID=1861 RepID=A0A1I5DTX0_9ACTN|nr:trypsin-like peptidase domain-containing protein [Geodermatophilus obscurus]SFO02637.1 serine protease, S1-C subfamily, contains C-terminal PDZ domain [Geodermatophilus obscurus]